MKRVLLTLAAVTAIAGAQATTPMQKGTMSGHKYAKSEKTLRSVIRNEAEKALPRQATRFRAAADAGLWMNWGFAEGVYTAVPTNIGEWKGAMKLSAELATEWAGATITSVSVGNPVDVTSQRPDYELMQYVYDNPVKEATVWVSESLDGEPIASASGELGQRGFAWSTIDLPQAVTIEAGKPLYIGYTLNVPADPKNPSAPYNTTYYCMTTDDSYYPDADGCYIYSTLQGVDNSGSLVFGDDYEWQDFGMLAGNVCVRAGINGDMLPVNIVRPYAWEGPQYVMLDRSSQFGVMVQNYSASKISSLEYTIEVEGMEPQKQEVVLDAPLEGYLDVSYPVYFDISSTVEGNSIPYSVYVSAINGESVDLKEYAIEGTFLCLSDGYPRNVVVEEYTGTWCGWCVVGYAGMEYMAKNYSDAGFIGIAVHGSDEMDVMGTGGAYSSFSPIVTGFPSSYVNRNMGNNVYPTPEELEETFLELVEVPAFAQISATLEKGDADNKLKLSTKSRFSSADDNAAYMVAYTVIEDGVGPYAQSNGAAGSGYDYYGFEDMAARVMLNYNDVARNCSQPLGVEGSLPAKVEKDTDYSYDTEITLGKEVDPTMVRVVAMLINGINGSIENACVVEAPGYVSVEEVSASAAPSYAYGAKGEIRFRAGAPAADVYAADGRAVASGYNGSALQAAPGIYLVSFGGKAVKVAVY
ncbi:MAG: hypothetical protein K2O78_03470 [Muribaculaceae bacterium]|nr:hypothetical protein [Muribaculaceae bacterium]MDE7080695.1 hypothetical protein [Muribaculaceae bacterium]